MTLRTTTIAAFRRGAGKPYASEAEIVRTLREVLKVWREPSEGMEEAADEPFHAAWRTERERSVKRFGKPAYASCAFSRPIFTAMLDALDRELEG